MTLQVEVRQTLGAFRLDAAFESAGRLTALFGPSGSGKSSLIAAIAGLSRPDHARIRVDGRVLVDTTAGVFVPAHRRRVGVVFQDARLFPHLSVRSNLLYGRWFAQKAQRYADFDRTVEMLGIGHLLERRPNLLSGGERQRVAVGRALLASPQLILMDEPLAALDDARKAEMMPAIERLRDETRIPIVYVSHSVAEVARLATDVVALSEGRVLAAGPADAMLRRLDLLPEGERGEGGSLIDMRVVGQDERFGLATLRSPAGDVRLSLPGAAIGDAVRIRIRARDVMIATEPPRGLSALNVLEGTIAAIDAAPPALADVSIDCGGQTVLARVTALAVDTLGLCVGMPVHAVVKSVSFDRSAATGGRVVGAARLR